MQEISYKMLNGKRKSIIALALAMAAVPVLADSIDDARNLVKEGQYQDARKILDQLALENKKITTNPQYMYLSGVCDYEAGDFESAETNLKAAKAKGFKAANLYLGRLAFQKYDFELASELYGEFRDMREKTNVVTGDIVDEFERELAVAENSISRVEQIVVIDSLAVPGQGFFAAYKLPSSAGRLVPPTEIPFVNHREGVQMAFVNEGDDFMMWGEPDSVGNVHIVESMRLTDGTWHEPVATPEILNGGGYADFPFMMPDGVTLYYSSNGDDSMGGYDIFVVSRDPQTGEYLQPQNIGMPFNSPADDYLLAIDEENGIGWWATDRNLLGDQLTIYVYEVNEMRKNYNPDDENIISKARLSDYKSTWDLDEEDRYENILATISEIANRQPEKKADFYFPKGNGEYYKHLDDFSSPEARRAMKKYLQAKDDLAEEEDNLLRLRQRYHANRASDVRTQIKQYETKIESQRADLIKLRSEVYRIENK